VLSCAYWEVARQTPTYLMRKCEGLMAEIIGYSRVSTDGQTLGDQIAVLKTARASKVFSEKQSRARSDRPQLRKAIGALAGVTCF
jgi:Resolvase, N terminal domain